MAFVLRRTVSKCANKVGISRLSSYFPAPVRCGHWAGGCEAAIHSARRYLETLPPDHVLVKLDFSNAFNNLHRLDMLNAVYDRLPDLYPYCISAYSQPSVLFYGSFILMSNEGPQQGDPLAPLLFSNTVQPLLLSRQTGLVLGFLDDFSLDHQNQVARDVQQIIEVGVRMGLSLNVSKCEVIADPATTITDPLLQSFERIATQDAILVHRYFWVQILTMLGLNAVPISPEQ